MPAEHETPYFKYPGDPYTVINNTRRESLLLPAWQRRLGALKNL